jgi:hypothetical protein
MNKNDMNSLGRRTPPEVQILTWNKRKSGLQTAHTLATFKEMCSNRTWNEVFLDDRPHRNSTAVCEDKTSCSWTTTDERATEANSFSASIRPVSDDRNKLNSSVSIVSDYGLDDWAIGVRTPAGAKDFSSNLQTGSEAHPTSCTMGTGGPFPGEKRSRVVTLTTHSHLVPRSRMSRSYTSSPPKRHHGV